MLGLPRQLFVLPTILPFEYRPPDTAGA
jgi:hypothetical protein